MSVQFYIYIYIYIWINSRPRKSENLWKKNLTAFQSHCSCQSARPRKSENLWKKNLTAFQSHCSCQSVPLLCNFEVRHPRCVGSITKNFCVLHIQSNTTIFHPIVHYDYNYMFRPYMWAIFRLWFDFQSSHTRCMGVLFGYWGLGGRNKISLFH